MSTRPTQRAAPPDSAGNLGSFDRDDNSLIEPSPNDLPGSTWESPRHGERPPKPDFGMWVTLLVVLSGMVSMTAYCASATP